MKVRDFKRVLEHIPDDADVVLDSRDGRGGYLMAITSIFPPDPEEGKYQYLVMLRAQRVYDEVLLEEYEGVSENGNT